MWMDKHLMRKLEYLGTLPLQKLRVQSLRTESTVMDAARILGAASPKI